MASHSDINWSSTVVIVTIQDCSNTEQWFNFCFELYDKWSQFIGTCGLPHRKTVLLLRKILQIILLSLGSVRSWGSSGFSMV